MEKTKRNIYGYEALISEFEELKNEAKPNRKRMSELKEQLASEKEYYEKEITDIKLANTRNKIQSSVSMDEATKNKQLEKLAYLEAQKELYTKNEDKIKECLSYRTKVFRKFNNSGKINRKTAAAIATTVAVLAVIGGSLMFGIKLGKDSVNKNTNVVSSEDTKDDDKNKDTDNKDDNLKAKDDSKSKEDQSEEENDKENEKESKDKDEKSNENQNSSKPSNSTTVTPNSGDTENATNGNEASTTTSKKVEPEKVPTTGKLPVEPTTETDNTNTPTITPGKTETTDDEKNNPDTDNVDESQSKKDDETTHFTPEEKEYEPEGTRTEYKDQEYDDEESKKQDTTGYVVDGNDETVSPVPSSKPSEPEGTPRKTPSDKTEEETSPTYIPPVTDDYIIESSSTTYSSNAGWTNVDNKENKEPENNNTTVETSSEPTIITYDEVAQEWVNINKDTVIEENNGTDYDTSDFTFPEDDEEIIEVNGKTLTYTIN